MPKKLKHFFLALISSLSFLLTTGTPTLAQTSENFETNLVTTYSVGLKGVTRVEHAFRIKNLTPEY
jgi:hypothetical protein